LRIVRGPVLGLRIKIGAILALTTILGTATHLLLAGQAVKPQQPAIPVRYTDVRKEAGITFLQDATQTEEKYYLETMGTGVAWLDYDQDGLMDLFFVQSAATDIYKPPHPLRSALYHNNGDGTFTDVTEKAGVGGEGHYGQGVAVGDYDNDGFPDLYVTGYGRAILYHNNGNGTFTDVTAKAGVADEGGWSTSAGWFDYDKDGWLDLVVTNYIEWSPKNNIWCGEHRPGYRSYCHPGNYKGQKTKLYHNNHDGTFTDVTEKAGFKLSGWTLDLGHADANNDGWDDLYIACDFGTDHFFVNNGDGTFTDKTESAIGFDTKKGMNVDWGDYDNDGLLDIYVTNITDDYMREGNFLWHNNGNLTFTDLARETGTHDTGWGWGAKFFDYDNDGWLDLYVVNGWVSAGKDSYVPDIFAMVTKPGIDFADARNWPPMGDKSLSGYQKKKLFHNEHGTGFKDEAGRHGVASTRDGRGVAVADFDNDGRMDLFVANANSEPYLYHNTETTKNHWAQFLLEGTKSNRSAVGAQVRVTAGGRTLLSFVNGGNGFGAQSTSRVHFGLGASSAIDRVEIRWPSGLKQVVEKLSADRIYKIQEGKTKTEVLEARR